MPHRATAGRFATRIAAATALLIVLLATCAGAATASNKSIWGPVELPDGSSAFPIYDDLGVESVQLQLNWNQIAPTEPSRPRDPSDAAYHWPAYVDEAIAEGRRYGIRVMLMIIGSPRWANRGRDAEWAPGARRYGRFVTAAARRYPGVRHWMIWGETNRPGTFRPLPVHNPRGPRIYARMLARAYGALKRESRRNIVIGGMTLSFGNVFPKAYARWMRLPNGRPAPLDMWGHNPFSSRFPDLGLSGFRGFPGARDFGDIDTFSRELHRIYRPHYKRFHRRGPKLWLSEFTISSDRANRQFSFYVSRRTQARWVRAAYRIANGNPWIAGLGWVTLLDEPPTIPDGTTTGLMTWDGKRKPAYYAYKRAR